MIEIILNFIIVMAALVFAVIIHEVAHGWVAYKLGDNTAKLYGRLTLNPASHADPFGSIILPIMLILTTGYAFGWAKPVPVNFNNLKHPQRDLVLVSGAGIVANFLLAGICAVFLRLFAQLPIPFLNEILVRLIQVNIVLAAFNILPIPPLDGSKIFFGWVKQKWAQTYVNSEHTGMMIILFAAFILPLISETLGIDLNIFSWYIINTSSFLLNLIL